MEILLCKHVVRVVITVNNTASESTRVVRSSQN